MEAPEHTGQGVTLITRDIEFPLGKKPGRHENILCPSMSTQCLQLLCFLWLLVAAGVYYSLMGR